ncbi:hypothetical protein PoB_002377500 [Plakobranchus ocellatus]|uniref:Uncharacterized protein n=1 Tax=Plakobranchus ocellatus TaxID=259542 RepID=A0AAV3ZRQ0_9GAST|nr:hypothetical protein PoB_002377500 [Plakobranchus ocellatus]
MHTKLGTHSVILGQRHCKVIRLDNSCCQEKVGGGWMAGFSIQFSPCENSCQTDELPLGEVEEFYKETFLCQRRSKTPTLHRDEGITCSPMIDKVDYYGIKA